MQELAGSGKTEILELGLPILLISLAPAGLENMFFEVGQPLAEDSETAPPPTQADIEKLLEAAPRYEVEIKVPHHQERS